MKKINEVIKKEYGLLPPYLLQFGTGNFLRGFVEWMVQCANEEQIIQGSVVISQVTKGNSAERLNQQDCLYTLVMRGQENNQIIEKTSVITSVSHAIDPYTNYKALLAVARQPSLKVIVSNTTEAGIFYDPSALVTDAPPTSFPAMLTALLYERYQIFEGDPHAGLLILPVELLENNGKMLHDIVIQYAKKWQLEPHFINWLNESNFFANTLVDRIVTGYPKEEIDALQNQLGYQDDLLVTSEPFNLWVIEAPAVWASVFPMDQTEANVLFTDDISAYKKQKVRLLNGAHTATSIASYLLGYETVLSFMQDDRIHRYVESIMFDEILHTLSSPEENKAFANAVIDRFSNSYIQHKLFDIVLNSSAKVATRLMDTILDIHAETGSWPPLLLFSLAVFVLYYRVEQKEDGVYYGVRSRMNDETYFVRDNPDVLAFFEQAWQDTPDYKKIVTQILSNKALWNDRDLTKIDGFVDALANELSLLDTEDTFAILRQRMDQLVNRYE